MTLPFRLLTVSAALAAAPAALAVDYAVVANDNHWTLANGAQVTVTDPPPDNLTVFSFDGNLTKTVAVVPAPASVIGPPLSVAPMGRLVLMTSCMKLDPTDPLKQIEDNRLTVIDLGNSTGNAAANYTARVVATLETGKAPAGVSINPQGTLALVANRGEGTVSVFTIQEHDGPLTGKEIAPVGVVPLGNATSALGHVTFTPDGKRALVTRDGDNAISILNVNGANVTVSAREIRTGLRPYAIDVTPDGTTAIVGNVGPLNGDADTIAVIDLKAEPPRVTNIYMVDQTPEGVKISPDGKYCAIVCQNGSNKAKDSPFFNAYGRLLVFRIDGTKLTPVASAPVGNWPQGVAFSNDSRLILVTNMVEKNVQVFAWNGSILRDTGQRLALTGGPAAIRTIGPEPVVAEAGAK